MIAGSPHALREEKAFLRTLCAGKEYVAVRGRDPATLILDGMRGSSPPATLAFCCEKVRQPAEGRGYLTRNFPTSLLK
jgi:hypothetical protein